MKLLWHYDFYDGPLSGMCLFQGRKHWFQCVDFDAKPRRFRIHFLTDDQIKAEEENHDLWVEYAHCDYDESSQRSLGGLHPTEAWNKFYSLPQVKRRYTNVVAVVTEEILRNVNA